MRSAAANSGGGRGGRAAGAVEVEEEDLPRRGEIAGLAAEADVLVAEVAVEEAGVVEAADGVGDALEEVHEGGAAGGLGVEAGEFVAEVGQVGDVGGDEAGFAEAGAVPAFGDGDGGGGADAGGAQEEGVAEGALGLGAVLEGEAVAPGGLGAVGLDDDIEGFAAGRQREAVDAVAARRDEGGGALLEEEGELDEGFLEAGPVPAGGHEEPPRAAPLPGGLSRHGKGRPAWASGAGSTAPSAWHT